MKIAEVNAVNRLNLYALNGGSEELKIYWIRVSCGENGETLNYRMHRHSFFELHFLIQGEMSYIMNGGELKVAKGQFTVVPPDASHAVMSQSEDFLKATVSIEACGSVAEALGRLSFEVHGAPDNVIRSFYDIAEAACKMKRYSAEAVRARLLETVYRIVEMRADTVEAPKMKKDDRVIKAKRYVEDNPELFLTCEEVARYCRLSAKQLGRLFMEQEGKSVLDYIHERKIAEAERLVSASDIPFETIAASLGFLSQSYFNKFFYRKTGYTPGVFRQMSREGRKNGESE